MPPPLMRRQRSMPRWCNCCLLFAAYSVGGGRSPPSGSTSNRTTGCALSKEETTKQKVERVALENYHFSLNNVYLLLTSASANLQ